MTWIKGATAYEWQAGRFWVRIVHLRNGGRFVWWAPWRRVSFHRVP
jgi:hypothetical protein